MSMPYPQLRAAVLQLPKNLSPVQIERHATVVDEELFVQSHINVIDAHPRSPNPTPKENYVRMYVVKPFYDRLYAYYLMKTQL